MKERVLRRAPPETRGRPHAYPWARWTDGRWREIEAKEFGASVATIRNAIYRHASRNEMTVKVTETEKGKKLAFQFTPNQTD